MSQLSASQVKREDKNRAKRKRALLKWIISLQKDLKCELTEIRDLSEAQSVFLDAFMNYSGFDKAFKQDGCETWYEPSRRRTMRVFFLEVSTLLNYEDAIFYESGIEDCRYVESVIISKVRTAIIFTQDLIKFGCIFEIGRKMLDFEIYFQSVSMP